MARPSRSLSELRVRMVDYDDFSSTGKENTSKFFRDIGNLNAVFRKRMNQTLALHPCVPMADMMQEYLKYQAALEKKYNVALPNRSGKIDRITTPEMSPQPQDRPVEPQPTTSTTSTTSGPSSPKPIEPKSAPSNPVSDFTIRPSKRKAADEKEADTSKKSVELFAKPSAPSLIPKLAPSATVMPRKVEEKPQNSLLKPPTVAPTKQTEEPKTKKPVFASVNFGPISSFSSENAQTSWKSVFPSSEVSSSQSEEEIPAKPSENNTAQSVSDNKSSFFSASANVPSFSFAAPKIADNSLFKLASTEPTNSVPTAPNPIFGSGSSSFFQPGGLVFGKSSFPSFSIPKPANDENEEGEGDDENEAEAPPIPVEDTEVPEPDAAISRKCAVFYLDNGKWLKRGTGTAHLKIISDSAVQLLIRVATSLGTILLNTRITKEMSVKRAKRGAQESVDILCIADPPIKGLDAKKPVQFVIKFKDATIADEFYNKLQSLLKK